MLAVKISFICSDISTVSRNDKMFITHLPSVELRHMEIWKGLAGASCQNKLDGITANVNKQAGQGLPRESFKDTKTISLLMAPQGALLCGIWWGSPSKNRFWNCQERTGSQKGNQVPNIHWNLWLQGSKTEFSALGGQLTAIVTT